MYYISELVFEALEMKQCANIPEMANFGLYITCFGFEM